MWSAYLMYFGGSDCTWQGYVYKLSCVFYSLVILNFRSTWKIGKY